MSAEGKSTISIKKADLVTQKETAISYKKLAFYHKATSGDTTISLSALSFPSEMLGFVQPSVAELQSVSTTQLKNNMVLLSSLRGALMPGLAYTIAGNGTITFTTDFGTALDGEIFIGMLDSLPRSGTLVADMDYIMESGTLAAGTTDISLGKSFKVNFNPSKQIGAVAVWVEGQLLQRNASNATASPSADGNYQEVDSGNGSSVLIRLNTSKTVSRSYVVMSTLGSTIKPDGSLVDELQRVQAVSDKLVATVADLAGVPQTNFQAAPTQVQLNQFGDAVANLSQSGTLGTPKPATSTVKGANYLPNGQVRMDTGAGKGSGDTAIRRFTNFNTIGTAITAVDSSTLGTTITINEDGIYSISYSDATTGVNGQMGLSLDVGGVTLTSGDKDTNIGTLGATKCLLQINVTSSYSSLTVCVRLSAGDVIRPHVDPATTYQGSDNRTQLIITQVTRL